MIMDRQTLVVIVGAIVGMVLLSGYFFGPARRANFDTDVDRPAYAQGDIRLKFQQADAKEKAKHPKKDKRPVKDQFVTDGRTSSGGGSLSSSDSSSDSEISEESSDEDSEAPSAEEPPIE